MNNYHIKWASLEEAFNNTESTQLALPTSPGENAMEKIISGGKPIEVAYKPTLPSAVSKAKTALQAVAKPPVNLKTPPSTNKAIGGVMRGLFQNQDGSINLRNSLLAAAGVGALGYGAHQIFTSDDDDDEKRASFNGRNGLSQLILNHHA
ncbi:MAG: hypothetical protein RR382_00435 [Tannerellaceae bacterium]